MSQALQVLGNTLPISSIEAYCAQVEQIPVLSAERENELAKRFHEENDLDAARELVMAHLRYVVRIARNYAGYGLAQADLIQEGNIGLMKAVKRFDPAVGVRLVAFAVHWIKAEIHEFIIRNWRIVKIATTKAQRKLFFNLRSMKQRLGWMNQEEIQAVAQDLGVTPKDVVEMEQRLNGQDIALENTADDAENNSTFFAPIQYLEAEASNPADLVEAGDAADNQMLNLHQALKTLDPRSQEILAARWLEDKKATLHELADKYGVSAERIRQLENNAMKKLKQQLTA